MSLLDRIPMLPLAIVAIFLAIAPISPQPHLVEKLSMLFAGNLVRPLDIFDLFLHSAALILLIIKLIRWHSARRSKEQA